MIRFDVHREEIDRDRMVRAEWTVAMWIDAGEVFSVTAHEDPDWSVLAFKATIGRRPMVVRGTAEAVAAQVMAHQNWRRWPARRREKAVGSACAQQRVLLMRIMSFGPYGRALASLAARFLHLGATLRVARQFIN